MIDKTKNYKIDVSKLGKVEKASIQKMLFKLGYGWIISGNTLSNLDEPYYFMDSYSDLTFSTSEETFNRSEYITITESELMQSVLEKSKKTYIKPPLGLMPRYIHDERRMDDIKDAVKRMFDANAKVNVKWVEEYNELCDIIKKDKNNG